MQVFAFKLKPIPVEMHVLERLYIIDGKHAEEALAGPHVLIPHGAVLLLTCGIEDVQETRLAIDHHLLPVRVLYGRDERGAAESGVHKNDLNQELIVGKWRF